MSKKALSSSKSLYIIGKKQNEFRYIYLCAFSLSYLSIKEVWKSHTPPTTYIVGPNMFKKDKRKGI